MTHMDSIGVFLMTLFVFAVAMVEDWRYGGQ